MSVNSGFHECEVKEVVFLTPAKVKVVVDGVEETVMTSVDIINRKVYLPNGDEIDKFSKKVFEHLDEINTLPEDFFMAPDEVREEAAKAESTRNQVYQEAMGASNERNIIN
jgi:glutathionyl-hydroquinone reductase